MKTVYLAFLLVLALFSFSESRNTLESLKTRIADFEKTAELGPLTEYLHQGLPVPVDIIEHLATIDLVFEAPEALTRRLYLLEHFSKTGFPLFFFSASLADCMDPEILKFLLRNGAQSHEREDLYTALTYEDYETANILLGAGYSAISAPHLRLLRVKAQQDLELENWLEDNLADLLVQ